MCICVFLCFIFLTFRTHVVQCYLVLKQKVMSQTGSCVWQRWETMQTLKTKMSYLFTTKDKKSTSEIVCVRPYMVKRLVYYQNRIQRCRLYALSCFPVNCQVWHVYTCAETSLIVMECLQHCISEFNRNVNLNNRVPYKIFPMPSTSSPTNNCQGSNLELRFSCHEQGRHHQSITSVSSHWLPPDSP